MFFLCINIRKVPRKVFNEHLPRDLANFNVLIKLCSNYVRSIAFKYHSVADLFGGPSTSILKLA